MSKVNRNKNKRLFQTTSTGFRFYLDKKRLANYELVESIAEVDDNPLVLPKLVKLLLGGDQADKLKNHVRDEDGIVSTEKMMSEIQEIFASQKVKN